MINHLRKNKNLVYSDKLDTLSNESNFITKLSIKQLIGNLDNKSKQLLYLLYFIKAKHNEISKIMKISKSTIKRRNKELILYLKEQIQDEKD